jgi:hypothetical protein
MQDTARLSDHAAARIDELQGEGISLTPAEIIRINSLGWAVESPETRLALSRGEPVSVGGVTLWPLTMQAYDWHNRVASQMRTVWLSNIALAYAMAHCYEEGSHYAHTGLQAVAKVTAWGWRLKCRMPELIEAMAQIIQQDETDSAPIDSESHTSIGDISANVSAITGLAPEVIESQMSMHHALRIASHTMRLQAQAAGGEHKSASYAMANRSMMLYMIEIRESRKAAE